MNKRVSLSMPPDLIPLLLLAIAALIVVFLRSWRRSHRELCCWRCGYPREGLDEALPCPECGSTGPWGLEVGSRSRLRLVRRMVAFSMIVVAAAWLLRRPLVRHAPMLWEYTSSAEVSIELGSQFMTIDAKGNSRHWLGQSSFFEPTPVPTPDVIHFKARNIASPDFRIERWNGMPAFAWTNDVKQPYSSTAVRSWLDTIALKASIEQLDSLASRIDLLAKLGWGGTEMERLMDEYTPGDAIVLIRGYSGRDIYHAWYKWGGWGVFLLVLFGGNWLIWRRERSRAPRAG